MSLAHSWSLIPSRFRELTDVDTWDLLQANGTVSYKEDPERNLSVTAREDTTDFSRFCELRGLVLDVGCGIQPWPSYFSRSPGGASFVGIDPLAGNLPAEYAQFRAVAEFLPFTDEAFDHVLFATSLDHVLDPLRALQEARRVMKGSGSIDIWVSSKSPDAPKPEHSHAWYERLRKPASAEDVFHIKRLEDSDLLSYCEQLGLEILREERKQIGEYRSQFFLSIR
jgi:SAM-dependent methyltransferase